MGRMSSDAQEVAAEVIDVPESELRITKAVPGSAIESNIGAVKAWVEEQLRTYSVPSIASEDDFRQAKRDRTALRKMGADVDNARKHVKQLYEAPLKEFEAAVKDITGPIKTLDAEMRTAIDDWDARKREKRRVELEAHYREFAPMLAEALPYERLHDDKWLNPSGNLMSAIDELEAKAAKIGGDLDQLDEMGTSMTLTHPVEAKARYLETLDMGDALRYDAELARREQAVRDMEAEREAMRQEPEPEPAPIPEPVPQQQTTAPKAAIWQWMMHIDAATPAQCEEIGRFCGSIGVTGKFTRIGEVR